MTGNSSSSVKESCKLLSEDTSLVKAVKILVYTLVLIVSLLGNSAIIAIVARNKRMRTTINYLIANMAASDLMIPTVAVPMKLYEIVAGPRSWLIDGIMGLILCKLLYFLRDISTAVSIQSLVVIAIDRYRGIVFPFRPPIITPKLCKVIIPLVWLTSMAIHIIYLYFFRLVSDNNITKCFLSWRPEFDPRVASEQYVTVVLVLIIVLPFCIITYLYSRIIWSLRKEQVARYSSSAISRRQRYEENTKVFKNICAIMIAFAFCVVPEYIYAILFYFVWKWKMPCNMEQFGFAVHFVLYSNAAISPVILYVFNDRYRQGLKDILKQLTRRQRYKLDHEELELNHLQHPPRYNDIH